MKLNNKSVLSFKEKLSCYLSPFEVVLSGNNWTFHSRLEKKNLQEINEYNKYGELKKVEEIKLVQKKAYRFFWTFNVLIICSTIVIVIGVVE